MEKPEIKYPECFGDLDTVFPMGDNGLRHSPLACMACVFKTECLRGAMAADSGIQVKEEMVNRAYESGMIGFIHRWSKKKLLYRKREKAARNAACGEEP